MLTNPAPFLPLAGVVKTDRSFAALFTTKWLSISTADTGSSREVDTVDTVIQQQTETDAGVNTVKMLSPGLHWLHKTVWTLTSGVILYRGHTIL